MPRPVRLSDVAKAAGVSLGTASNVFNRPDVVRPEVREQVLEAARTLAYTGPDAVGRLLMGGLAHAIAVIPPGDMPVSFAMASPYLRALVTGIAEICDEQGASLVIGSGADDRKAWTIQNALVDGFILGHLSEIDLVRARRRKVPFVVMDMAGGADVNSVRIDVRTGARLAAEHLLKLGHRRFAIVSVQRHPAEAIWHPPSSEARQLLAGYPIDHEKLLGYADALSAAGINIESVPLAEIYPPSPWAETGAEMLLAKAPEATAILVMSDKNALAVVQRAISSGRRVPDDLSVVGFDDVAEAATLQPPLTTVRQDIAEKGRVAARMLFSGETPSQIVLPVDLVVRGTTASPRKGAG